MNYGAPYNPSYGAASAYAAPYATPYAPQYPLVWTGQAVPGGMAPAMNPPVLADTPAAAPAITSPEWWKLTTFNIPRWALAAGAVSLGLIGYGWQSGWFDGGGHKSTSRSRTSRDVTRRRRRSHKRHASSGGSHHRRSHTRRRRASHRRRHHRDASFAF